MGLVSASNALVCAVAGADEEKDCATSLALIGICKVHASSPTELHAQWLPLLKMARARADATTEEVQSFFVPAERASSRFVL
mmetsp:Transcript_29396/g.75810  ORF Transcript_29396/g.75810 Transcript_29396/m.75810 type:complete len:82 (+) Transcript_29396:1372-1617(+)